MADEATIASNIIGICDGVIPVVDELAPILGEAHARSLNAAGNDSARRSIAGIIGAEPPFAKVKDTCQSIVNNWVGWSAESSGKRMPEYIVGLVDDGDYTWYASFLAKDVQGDPEIDPDGKMFECLSEIGAACQAIKDELEPLIGKYGSF